MAGQPNQIGYGTQSPASAGDTNYWQTGDIVYNNTPATTYVQQGITYTTTLLSGENPTGWVCLSSGYPGTWAPITPEPTQFVTNTIVPTQTLAQAYRYTLLNFAQTGTASLPEASQNMAGAVLTFMNLNATTVTLAPLSTDNYNGGVAAITLAQYAAISITSDGLTHWYKVS